MEKRVYSDKNKRGLTQALAGIDFSVHGTQSSFDLFHGKLLTLLNKYLPQVRIKKNIAIENLGYLRAWENL